MKEETLIRFLNNQSPPKERKEVLEWLDQEGMEQELEEIILRHWNEEESVKTNENQKYRKILDRIQVATLGKKKKNRNFFIRRLIGPARIAAGFLLVLFSAYFLVESWKTEFQEPVVEEFPPQLIERVTGAGEKLRITLPDQSKVVVNSLSTIGFTSDFGKSERRIYLDGEAYFEIVPDKDKPFKVQTGAVVTTALGTAFNAYSRGKGVEISLTEGMVLVSHKSNEKQLRPGERAAVKENITVDKFDMEQVTAWKEGKIRFKSKSLMEIMKTLEKWYGVNITIRGDIDQNRKVSGLFDNENLEDILHGLSFSLGLDYSINGKNVIIQ